MAGDLSPADRGALHDLVLTYSRAVDRRDFALLRSLYHDDSVEEHGSMFSGSGPDFVDYVSRTVIQFEQTAHYVVNALFTGRGAYAEGEIYKVNYHRTRGPDRFEVTTGSRSHDRYEKRDGVWRFSYRAVVLDWARKTPVDEEAYRHFAAGSPPGQPDATDLSYSRLSLFGRGIL
jgi:hypothetical protein